MTTIPTAEDRVSIRLDDPDDPSDNASSLPMPGPMSLFVVLGAVICGLAAAFAFQALSPDTPFVILGATLLSAVVLGVVGLYRYEWFLLSVLAIRPSLDDLIADEFGTFQPSAILGILAILVTLLHLISRKVSGTWHRPTPLGYAFIGFFILFIPSFITSVDRGVSQAAMFGLASVTLLYLAIEQQLLDDRRTLIRILIAAAVGMVVPFVVGFVQFFFTGTLDPGGSGLVRIDGSFAHPNTFATYLSFAILLGISLIPSMEIKHKLVAIAAAGAGAFLLVSTFARGAWGSFLLGTLLLAARINKMLVFAIIGGAGLIGVSVPGVRSRIQNLTSSTGPGGAPKTDDSIGWRFGYWERIWPLSSRNPISGLGIDATKTQTPEAKDPHNSFLQAYLEGGVLGAVGFFTLLGLATYACWNTWQRARRGEFDRPTMLISVGAIAALLSVGAQLVTENVLLNTVVWWYLNIGFALIAVLTWGARRADDAFSRPGFPLLELTTGKSPESQAALGAGDRTSRYEGS